MGTETRCALPPEKWVKGTMIVKNGEVGRANRLLHLRDARAGRHGWMIHYVAASGKVVAKRYLADWWLAKNCAPLADEPREEPADARLCREEAQARASEAPAPTGCARVAAVNREIKEDWKPWWSGSLNGNLEVLQFLIAIADKWRPRLHEFEPCGDCPPCLALEAAGERHDEEIAPRCCHGVKIGGWCYFCPGGRAR